MRSLLPLEGLGLFLLAAFLFIRLPHASWPAIALLLLPDLGMLDTPAGPSEGSAPDNLTHHRGLKAANNAIDAIGSVPPMAVAGVLELAHASLDRVFGCGPKDPDPHRGAHPGWVGRGRLQGVGS